MTVYDHPVFPRINEMRAVIDRPYSVNTKFLNSICRDPSDPGSSVHVRIERTSMEAVDVGNNFGGNMVRRPAVLDNRFFRFRVDHDHRVLWIHLSTAGVCELQQVSGSDGIGRGSAGSRASRSRIPSLSASGVVQLFA